MSLKEKALNIVPRPYRTIMRELVSLEQWLSAYRSDYTLSNTIRTAETERLMVKIRELEKELIKSI